MPAPATHADALRLEYSATEVAHLDVVGTIPGVVPIAVAARCGVGTARIRSRAAGIAFKAPGSATWGPAVDADADGSYLLEDGDDRDKWLRVTAYTAFLLTPREGRILLADRFNNPISSDNVSAAEASAGDVEDVELAVANDGSAYLSQVLAWIDAGVAGLQISPNGADWSAPTTEATALALADVPPAGDVALHVRRTIAASAPSDPDVLNHLHLSFSGI